VATEHVTGDIDFDRHALNPQEGVTPPSIDSSGAIHFRLSPFGDHNNDG
jgi:hypothetical protein